MRILVQFAGVFDFGIAGGFIFCCALGFWLLFLYGVLDGGIVRLALSLVIVCIVWLVGSSNGLCDHVADCFLGWLVYAQAA